MKGLFHKFPSVLYFSYRIVFFFFFFFFGGGGGVWGHKIEVLASGIIKPLHATAPAALSFFLSFGCHYSLSPLPSCVPLIPSSVFSCFYSLLFILFLPSFLLFLFSLLFSGPTVFSFVSFPLPSFSGSLIIFFLHLFLLYCLFLPFLSVIILLPLP